MRFTGVIHDPDELMEHGRRILWARVGNRD